MTATGRPPLRSRMSARLPCCAQFLFLIGKPSQHSSAPADVPASSLANRASSAFVRAFICFCFHHRNTLLQGLFSRTVSA